MDENVIHVAAAVISNPSGEILIARRPDDKHQGGLWEFPGGKVEAGESIEQALQRELQEELGISVTGCQPLITVRHDYPDKSVLLDVWQVDSFSGDAHGREGQPVRWVKPGRLSDYSFPEANIPIMKACLLPDCYMITPEPSVDGMADFMSRLEQALQSGIRLVQLRAKQLDMDTWQAHARAAIDLCRQHDAFCILNASIENALSLAAQGVHLNSQRLFDFTERPVPEGIWLVASCHTEQDLEQAAQIKADFVVLSPVMATASHPDATPLGWQRFQEMVSKANIPVYALGGMHIDHQEEARRAGAQGIAAIRSLWPSD